MLSKELLGLAGEYAVASQLCQRGFYCQLTLGNHKKTDLIIKTDDDQFASVSVKTKQKSTWPGVKGISQKGELLIFVDYQNKGFDESPDFYVVNLSNWKKVVNLKKEKDPRAKIDENNTLYWPGEGDKNAFTGCEITIKDVSKFKDAWPKFTKSED